MAKSSFVAATLALVVASFASCSPRADTSKPSATNGAKLYAITADSASFFRYGPQQGNGPDKSLPRDTLVKLIRPSFGYSKIQLVTDGQMGYVASEDIRLAPASLVLAASAKPTPSMTAAASPGFNLNSSDPRLVSPPEQLPSPDLPPETSSDSPSASPSPNP